MGELASCKVVEARWQEQRDEGWVGGARRYTNYIRIRILCVHSVFNFVRPVAAERVIVQIQKVNNNIV